ncbi:MAG TPA: hypothetical protein VEC36_12140 [Patescibacteria group bacterium]|nr:hypothetical protein [Patescibacteria group bacterium]
MKKVIPALALAATLTSCNNEPEDLTHDIDKSGSIETALSVKHLDSSRDVLTTTHKVWAQNTMIRQYSYSDTIPRLGSGYQMSEMVNGDVKNMIVPKDYQFFVTVK